MTAKEHLIDIAKTLDLQFPTEGLDISTLSTNIKTSIKDLKSKIPVVAEVKTQKMDFLSSPSKDIPPVRVKDEWLYVMRGGRWEHEGANKLTPQKIKKLMVNRLPLSREQMKEQYEGNLPFDF